jgi:hypothetical protein
LNDAIVWDDFAAIESGGAPPEGGGSSPKAAKAVRHFPEGFAPDESPVKMRGARWLSGAGDSLLVVRGSPFTCNLDRGKLSTR